LFMAFAIRVLIGAIAGFALPARRKKLAMLFVLRSFERGFAQGRKGLALPVYLLSLTPALVLLGSWISSLWVFWRYPTDSATAKAIIAVLQFAAPAVALTVISLVTQWHIVASESVDDDV